MRNSKQCWATRRWLTAGFFDSEMEAKRHDGILVLTEDQHNAKLKAMLGDTALVDGRIF